MIRRRFPRDRLLRIGAWVMAAVTSAVAFVSKATAEDAAPAPAQPTDTATASGTAALPVAPDTGLLILRYQPRPTAEPPAITRQAGTTVTTPARSSSGTVAAPQTPPPPPRLSTVPAKVQSSGS